jgi:hypothetical protein
MMIICPLLRASVVLLLSCRLPSVSIARRSPTGSERAAFHLRPIHSRFLAHLRSSTKLFAHERTAPVFDPGCGRTKTGQLWAYAQDDRPSDGSDPPAVAYSMRPTARRRRSQSGILPASRAIGRRLRRLLSLAEKGRGEPRVLLGECAAAVLRTRRGAPPIACKALQRIAALYRNESNIRGRGPEQRRDLRLARARVVDLEPPSPTCEHLSPDKLSTIYVQTFRQFWGGIFGARSATLGQTARLVPGRVFAGSRRRGTRCAAMARAMAT